jgi:hypothetical protein
MQRKTRTSTTVFSRVSKLFVLLALVATTGFPWMILQTVAWTTMLADNLHSASLNEALVKTFDGQHPCCLCKAIAAEKKNRQKHDFALTVQKLEFPPLAREIALNPPSPCALFPSKDCFADSLTHEPLLPPPRGFSA